MTNLFHTPDDGKELGLQGLVKMSETDREKDVRPILRGVTGAWAGDTTGGSAWGPLSKDPVPYRPGWTASDDEDFTDRLPATDHTGRGSHHVTEHRHQKVYW